MSGLPSLYQSFIHLSRYSRWMEEEGRRETWEETVNRYFEFFTEHLKTECNYDVPDKLRKELQTAVTNLEIMPSMRALMTAGEALKRDNVAGYNCSYVSASKVKSFDEILYILMCGTGVGFSVERDLIKTLPTIAEEFEDSDTTIIVKDSKMGWAKAYRELFSLLIGGQVPKWDTSKVRPAGARLKTFGGRASGPEPLEDLFRFTVETFRKAAGRKLTSIECHDIICKIAEIVVVGGVRRSALISLSSLTDERMRDAKSGAWWEADHDMGYEIGTSIGASLHGKRTYVIVGDGSFQYNIQDLQTIRHNNLPITILVFNNDGYGAIKITQNMVFKREFGTSSKSDLTFCNIEKVAKSYDIPYYRVWGDGDVGYLYDDGGLTGPKIVEIVCETQGRFPKLSNKPQPDGTFKNMPYEEMAPFLDDAFLEANLFVSRI